MADLMQIRPFCVRWHAIVIAACADDWSGSSRSIWSKSLSALGSLEEVERGRRGTVVLSDR